MSSRRRRVLHVLQSMQYGGMERLLADLVRGVNPSTIESHVLVLEYLGRFAQGLEQFATLHQAEPMSRWSLIRPTRLARTIGAIAPDVVHTHSGVWYKTSLAARMAGVPRVIHTEHGRHAPDPWTARFLDGLASRRTDVAVGVSESVATLLERTIVRGNCRVEVVLNGIDTDRFQPRPDTGRLRAELRVAPTTPILGSIGRLQTIKGYDVMIEAFAALPARDDFPPPVLVIAGDGPHRPELERRITAHGLTARVHILGWRDDVEDLLSAFHCFTMSSHSEGTSISLLEAMSSGLCPVVTDVGGNRAVLGPRLAHRLVPRAQPATLAQAWVNALADRSRLRADAEAVRERIVSTYSIAQTVAAYEQLYDGRAPRQANAGLAAARTASTSRSMT